MPLDVIVDLLVLTPNIGPSNDFSEELEDEFRKAVTSTLQGKQGLLDTTSVVSWLLQCHERADWYVKSVALHSTSCFLSPSGTAYLISPRHQATACYYCTRNGGYKRRIGPHIRGILCHTCAGSNMCY